MTSPIVDPHQHFWHLSLARHHWLIGPVRDRVFGDYSAIQRNYLLGDYLEDTKNQNVVKSVHIEAEFDETEPVEETRWLQAHADKHGFPHGIVGNADLAAADAGDVLDQHMQYGNFRGIRHTLCYDPDPRKSFSKHPDIINSVEFRAGFQQLENRALSFDLAAYYHQAEDSFQLAKRFANTQFIVNHAGFPLDKSAEGLINWRAAMKRLAGAPNIATKISGFGVSDPNWTLESIRPLVLHLIDCFGIERCMFASNFPVDKLFKTYDEIFSCFKDIVNDFSAGDKKRLFHDNAVRLYKI
ncbi:MULTISPECIES: amidohydrolase family protein [unclassified Mesorhizobium]|uniref:amidohydrolase family protein n=1 Tax=unclassified Mesorhizobium TaxID=325217 RepID=UPI0024152604|nr:MULTISPECIES: amidohydrolase family protein [unclassified Mesorhizobium]MDG4889885.1 amidohydrolase family protein [Mesorhizobium sp. WSM4887]MDG4904028.1 amidohydrolase family protein [Mesorhizobium sp. WSM4962]MDG4909055.1 amidohydrolase family protein [Mesorhizobium sp. WSM4898]MDG4921679.1 amidohydrolase family protein [Mesorhizobium sp. WSM4989]